MELPDFLTNDNDENIRMRGHRISLQDVVRFYNEGYSSEMLIGEEENFYLSRTTGILPVLVG